MPILPNNYADKCPSSLAQNIVDYMEYRGDYVCKDMGAQNIVYLEGAWIDGTENDDSAGRWNDMSYLIGYRFGIPYVSFAHIATTEPGQEPTNAPKVKKGVARIAFGQQFCVSPGFHKNNPNHPALVQRAPTKVFRDFNKDGIRTGDVLTTATGINDHGTRVGYEGKRVGFFSEGCCVRWLWKAHLEFMKIVLSDPRVIKNPTIILPRAVYGADSFAAYLHTRPDKA